MLDFLQILSWKWLPGAAGHYLQEILQPRNFNSFLLIKTNFSFSIKYQRNASLDNILQISQPNIEAVSRAFLNPVRLKVRGGISDF